MKYKKLKRRAYEILEKGEENDNWSRRFDLFIISLIFLNIFAVIVESVDWIAIAYTKEFYYLETFSIIVFTIEFVGRLWSITANKEHASPALGRLKYLFSFYGLVDLVALLPAYIPLFFGADLRVVRGIRILRLFRILKLSRYNKAFMHIKRVVETTKEELLISLIAVLTLLVIASSLMYFTEHDVQPDVFPNIPATMWWGVATLTTVGYGDVYPITAAGKIMAGVMAILGIGIFALPAGILANGFNNTIEDSVEEKKGKNKKKTLQCDHCGKEVKT
ncbi:MAG: voltage-gated potassium channel [Vicingaceae bacterium]|jgi:voltage-gated potassium channel